MDKNNLFKEALADAKTLQRIAVANAKKSLEEVFGPKIESMFKEKMAEAEKNEMEEGMSDMNPHDPNLDNPNDPNHDIRQMEEELDSVLQELGMNDEVSEGENLDEKEEKKPQPKKKPAAPASEDEDEVEADLDSDMGEEEPSTEVVDLSVAELEDIVRNAVQAAMGGGASAGMDDEMSADDTLDGAAPDDQFSPKDGDEELDLDELMAELDNGGLDESEEIEESEELDENEELDESEDLEESEDINEAEWYEKKAKSKMAEAKKALAEAKQWYNANPKGKKIKGGPKKTSNAKPAKKTAKISETQVAKENKQLKETLKQIKTTLSETNLLNAKLLFVNKLFKGKQLSESQKVKVISAFDKARTKDEAKTIYESLHETLNTKKTPLKESIGFASKSIAGFNKPKQEIIAEDASVSRMKKLAGII